MIKSALLCAPFSPYSQFDVCFLLFLNQQIASKFQIDKDYAVLYYMMLFARSPSDSEVVSVKPVKVIDERGNVCTARVPTRIPLWEGRVWSDVLSLAAKMLEKYTEDETKRKPFRFLFIVSKSDSRWCAELAGISTKKTAEIRPCSDADDPILIRDSEMNRVAAELLGEPQGRPVVIVSTE